jgi:hypothetical protein
MEKWIHSFALAWFISASIYNAQMLFVFIFMNKEQIKSIKIQLGWSQKAQTALYILSILILFHLGV